MSKPFDKVYKHYDRFMKFWGLYRTDLIINMLSPAGSEVVADIGGGTGFLARKLADFCDKVYVIDESTGMLSRIQGGASIIPVQADALKTGFDECSFDAVVLSDVFHHIKDTNTLMEEIYRILKPGGTLLIHDFDINKVRTKLLRMFEKLLFKDLYFKSIDQVRNIVGNHKFYEADSLISGNFFIVMWRKE